MNEYHVWLRGSDEPTVVFSDRVEVAEVLAFSNLRSDRNEVVEMFGPGVWARWRLTRRDVKL